MGSEEAHAWVRKIAESDPWLYIYGNEEAGYIDHEICRFCEHSRHTSGGNEQHEPTCLWLAANEV